MGEISLDIIGWNMPKKTRTDPHQPSDLSTSPEIGAERIVAMVFLPVALILLATDLILANLAARKLSLERSAPGTVVDWIGKSIYAAQ